MEVFFIRHGHASHNEAYERLGEIVYTMPEYTDSQLTSIGHLQTINASVPKMDAIYSSPLTRCIQTSKNMFGNVSLYLDDGLLETQGEHLCNLRKPREELEALYPSYDFTYVSPNYTFTIETYDELKERTSNVLQTILKKSHMQGHRRIAIVTHHDVLMSLFNKSMRNGEVHRVYVYSGKKGTFYY